MTLDYPILIERLPPSDGGGYIASAPDLPGCMSDGETPEEALRNIAEAIDSWIAAAKEWNREVPKPSRPLAHSA
jgi:predicted RNase H-like HicB family nuclease